MGNPFRGENAIGKYRQWIAHQPKLLARVPELRGKTLGCWCAPQGGLPPDINGRVCHGQVLAALAEGATFDVVRDVVRPACERTVQPPMKAISLTQPFATLVAIGAKRIETRSWSPFGLVRGDRLAIHASKSFPQSARDLCGEEPFWGELWRSGNVRDWRELPLGAAVATVQFNGALPTDAVFDLSDEEAAFGNFAVGRFAWLLSEPRLIDPPVPARGRLGVWEWEVPPRWERGWEK